MKAPSFRKAQSGSFLIEALISMLLFVIGLLTLIALASQGLNQVGLSKARNEASNLASELIGAMWVSSATPSTYDITNWKNRVQAALPGGDATVTVSGAASNQVAIEITWVDAKDGSAQHKYVTTALIVKN